MSESGSELFAHHRRLSLLLARSEALRAANSCDLLKALVEHACSSPEQLAALCSTDPQATETILKVLADGKVVIWDGENFLPGPLLKDGSLYLQANIWSHTEDFLKGGHRGKFEGARATTYKEGTPTLAEWWTPAAAQLASEVKRSSGKPPKRILDFGSGAGTWSLPLLRAFPHAKAVAFDFPEVLPGYKKRAQELGVEKRISLHPGDFKETLKLEGTFDLIVLGMVLHLESRRFVSELIARLRPFLGKAGSLLIVESFGGQKPPKVAIADLQDEAVYELSLALRTHEGRPHSLVEYQKMLTPAGLKEISQFDFGADYQGLGCLWATAL